MQEQNKRRALGKGLEELFNMEDLNYNTVNNLEERIIKTASDEEVKTLSLTELRPNPYQPRKKFDEEALNELAESIKEHGVIQPIIVKKSIKGYEIIAGERRYRASILAGKETIPAIVRNFTDEEMMQIAILENLQRENLNAIEEAEAYKNLMERLNLNQEEAAKKVGKSRSHITNMLGLLKLPASVKKLINENKISMGHARVLSKLEDEQKIIELADKIVKDNLSVRQLESLADKDEYVRTNKITKSKKNREYKYIEEELTNYLGSKTRISKNKIEISYTNINDLNRILEIIGYHSED